MRVYPPAMVERDLTCFRKLILTAYSPFKTLLHAKATTILKTWDLTSAKASAVLSPKQTFTAPISFQQAANNSAAYRLQQKVRATGFILALTAEYHPLQTTFTTFHTAAANRI